MIGFIKYLFTCLLLLFDYAVFNFDKTPAEEVMATHGAIGVAIFVLCFIYPFLKMCFCEDLYDIKFPFRAFLISLALMVLYFAIVYFGFSA